MSDSSGRLSKFMAQQNDGGDLDINPIFTRPGEATSYPADRFTSSVCLPGTAYQVVHNLYMVDGNARMNLSSFGGTGMADEAVKRYTESVDKSMIV